MNSAQQVKWTNPSVKKFAGDKDPIFAIEEMARAVALAAFDKGWSGPPFDPIRLADLLGIKVRPRVDIADARTIPIGGKGAVIEFNPTRPRGRVRFSVAHEIAHTFFPDFSGAIRYRSHNSPSSDAWQLEMLCNIAAAELVMPIGSFPELSGEKLTIEHLVEVRTDFDVSMEAVLIRATKLSQHPVAAFVASARDSNGKVSKYQIDYVIPSPNWQINFIRNLKIPAESVVGDCGGIGFTSKGVEKWLPEGPRFYVQCIGLPPYPGASSPRIAGLLQYHVKKNVTASEIEYRYGDALEPKVKGYKLIAHVVNDKTSNWGGRGFALAVRKKWDFVQDDFRQWVNSDRRNLTLGRSHITNIGPDLS